MLVMITARASGALSGVSARMAEMPRRVVDGTLKFGVVALIGLIILALG